MKKNIYCKHYLKEARITETYTYKMISGEINLCRKCEAKLRKQILEQIELEKKCERKLI